ncbi:hypothetical protein CA262_09730 [Sphingobium sp. GW456-12-10-14-TSB1]|uniref:Uncharacterized protein n=1 Tax=Sphingobium xenophagum TaxID=121428 RepID=A0A249MP01_SPHXE|nr:hypothetical protein CJD35_00460 [Sphingobium xenophagum]OUC55101.1 hypothetical protein CA262_09730 [Sphingobium sp. GW456-12-10-14-TSB1]
MAVGQTEGYQPLDRATPLHHFVVPLPLQGRNFRALLVACRLALFFGRPSSSALNQPFAAGLQAREN